MQLTYSIQYRSSPAGPVQTINLSFSSTQAAYPAPAMATLETALLEAPLQLLVGAQAYLHNVHRADPTHQDLTVWAIQKWQSEGPICI